MASLNLSAWLGRSKPAKPPKPAVTARLARTLDEIHRAAGSPSPELRRDYGWYLEIKRRQRDRTA